MPASLREWVLAQPGGSVAEKVRGVLEWARGAAEGPAPQRDAVARLRAALASSHAADCEFDHEGSVLLAADGSGPIHGSLADGYTIEVERPRPRHCCGCSEGDYPPTVREPVDPEAARLAAEREANERRVQAWDAKHGDGFGGHSPASSAAAYAKGRSTRAACGGRAEGIDLYAGSLLDW